MPKVCDHVMEKYFNHMIKLWGYTGMWTWRTLGSDAHKRWREYYQRQKELGKV